MHHHHVCFSHTFIVLVCSCRTYCAHSFPLLPLLQAVVDIATLTGACIIALGGEVAGLFTPSDDMAASINDASKAAGEKVCVGVAEEWLSFCECV